MEPLQMVSHGYQTLKGWQVLMISSVGPSGLIGNDEFLAGVPLPMVCRPLRGFDFEINKQHNQIPR